ncbi:hypothetical protein ACJX0J_022817, partial [Zea mays]
MGRRAMAIAIGFAYKPYQGTSSCDTLGFSGCALALWFLVNFINSRLVRRRLRHIAVRGASVHKKFLYGSVCLLPVTSVFMVLPLPNIPFFWVLFRAYSHWRALQGSERLELLVSDCSDKWKVLEEKINSVKDGKPSENARNSPW